MIKEDLVAERIAENDPTTRRVMEEVLAKELAKEEEHAEDMKT